MNMFNCIEINNEMPTEGQFVRLHMHNDVVWSTNLKWIAGKLREYIEATDTFEEYRGYLRHDITPVYITEV